MSKYKVQDKYTAEEAAEYILARYGYNVAVSLSATRDGVHSDEYTTESALVNVVTLVESGLPVQRGSNTYRCVTPDEEEYIEIEVQAWIIVDNVKEGKPREYSKHYSLRAALLALEEIRHNIAVGTLESADADELEEHSDSKYLRGCVEIQMEDYEVITTEVA